MKILVYIMLAVLGLFMASEWWEKVFATRTGFTISPGGCYRLESYKPLWILPNTFHSQQLAGYEAEWIRPFTHWELPPTFYRLYDHRTGKLMATTGIYDYRGPLTHGSRVRWGNSSNKDIRLTMLHIGWAKPDCLDG